jgi:tRNA(fMet)-specific endonuclease VapC
VLKVIFDTDILSEAFKQRDPIVLARTKEYLRAHSFLTYTSVSLVEIISGLHAKDAKQQLARAEAFLSRHEQIIPDGEDYMLAARIIGDLYRTGRPIGWNDPVIAACAIRRDMPIATANTRHYQNVIDIGYSLILQNWRNP